MIFYGISILIAVFLLLIIAEPALFFPEKIIKKRRVGGTYWGCYEGNSEEPDPEQTIVVEQSVTKTHSVYGSSTYAQGRGVNMSGRG